MSGRSSFSFAEHLSKTEDRKPVLDLYRDSPVLSPGSPFTPEDSSTIESRNHTFDPYHDSPILSPASASPFTPQPTNHARPSTSIPENSYPSPDLSPYLSSLKTPPHAMHFTKSPLSTPTMTPPRALTPTLLRGHTQTLKKIPPQMAIRKNVGLPTRRPVRSRKKRISPCCFCCYICSVLVLLAILLLGAFCGIAHVWLKPKYPSFHLSSIRFRRFNVTVGADGTYLNSEALVKLKAVNRNGKITLHYSKTHARMTILDDVGLGSAVIPDFTQEKKNSTILAFGTQVTDAVVDDQDGEKLMYGFSSAVSLEIRTRTKVTLNGWNWELGKVTAQVLCRDMTMLNSTDGKCKFKVLKWW